jgi:hypothetical protein
MTTDRISDFSALMDEEVTFVLDLLNDRSRAIRVGKSTRKLFLGQSIDLFAAYLIALITSNRL